MKNKGLLSGFSVDSSEAHETLTWFGAGGREIKNVEGGVGVNANYLSHPSNSVISSSLAIRFTKDVVILRNRANGAPVHPNFHPVLLVFRWPQLTPFLTPSQVLCLFFFFLHQRS